LRQLIDDGLVPVHEGQLARHTDVLERRFVFPRREP
jgi:hypothetical protein